MPDNHKTYWSDFFEENFPVQGAGFFPHDICLQVETVQNSEACLKGTFMPLARPIKQERSVDGILLFPIKANILRPYR